LFTWNANVSFLDLGKEGAVLTLAGGQLPRAGSVDGTVGRDRGQSWIVEGQYNYPVTDNISITPGVYAIFDPNNTNSGEDTIVVGVIRTVFKF
jgi:carbohydrate-selective porin OprB